MPSSTQKPTSQPEPQTLQPEKSIAVNASATSGTAEANSKRTQEILASEVKDAANSALQSPPGGELASTVKSRGKGERPDDIDIAATKNTAVKDAGAATKAVKSSVAEDKNAASLVAASRPVTPENASSVQTALSPPPRSNQHKVLRDGPTLSKQETPTKHELIATAVPASPSNVLQSASSIDPSRRTSLTSIQQPSTPSDNASFTSASLSRANSPPPSRVGTAPVRQMSKAQQKKERQARAKQAEEVSKVEQSPIKLEEPAIVQEPIVGRKKKAKKTQQGTAESTPAPTRPTSPEAKDIVATETQEEPVPALPTKEIKKINAKATPAPEPKKVEEPPRPPTPSVDDQQKQLTAAALFSSLIETGELDPGVSDSIFKTAAGLNTRFDNTTDLISPANRPVLTDEEAHQLDAGQAICIEDRKGRCTVVLPDRRPLPGFSRPQAQRFLDLVARIGVPPFNPDLWKLVPIAKLTTAAVAITPLLSAQLAQESKELVNRFATDLPTVGGGVLGQGGMPQQAAGATAAGGQLPVVATAPSVEEAEQRFLGQRRETEAIEKKLNALIKKNRRLVLGGGH